MLWTLEGSTRVTVAGLTPMVRRTKLLGGAVRLVTIDGKLTVTATPDPLYIETL